jgi:hypothetical protein
MRILWFRIPNTDIRYRNCLVTEKHVESYPSHTISASVLYRGGRVDTIVGAENPPPSQFCAVQVSDSCVVISYRLTFQVYEPEVVLLVLDLSLD